MIKQLMIGLCLTSLLACNPTDKKSDMETKNQVIETIMTRRSIRNYVQKPVDRDTMNMILECGIYAPNGQNKQSWEVRIIDDAEMMAQLTQAMVAANSDIDAEFVAGCFRGAPTMAFIANDLSYDFSVIDCGLLAQNMMLSAWSMGVGSIALGSPVRFIEKIPADNPVIQKLGFSDGYKLVLCVGFGYPNETPVAKPRDWGKVKFVD